MTNYWLVGADWSGDDQAHDFFERGSWEVGYSDAEKPDYAEKRDSMRRGDRIAVKKGHGSVDSNLTIRALGIVKQVHNRVVYVDWLVTDLQRTVDGHGAYATIHGPYIGDDHDGLIKDVFCL